MEESNNLDLSLTPSLKVNDTPSDQVKLDDLTPKNRLFLEYLGAGKPTVEAYKLAGYTGKDHSAYELRSYLGKYLEAYLAAKGLDRSRLISAFSELLDIPILKPDFITVDMRLKLLKEASKFLPKADQADKPKITEV